MAEFEIDKEIENDCCEEEDQPYRKTDYKPFIYNSVIMASQHTWNTYCRIR